MANKLTASFCLDTPLTGSSLPSNSLLHGWAVQLHKFFFIRLLATLSPFTFHPQSASPLYGSHFI